MVLSCSASDIRRVIGWKLSIFPPLSYSAPRSLCSLWNFVVKLTTRKLDSWGETHVVKVAWSWLQPFLTDIGYPPVWRTDGQAGGRAIAYAIAHYSILLLLYKSYKKYINRVHEKQNSARCNQISTVQSAEINSLTSESWKKLSAI